MTDLRIRFTRHALWSMARRGVDDATVRAVVGQPTAVSRRGQREVREAVVAVAGRRPVLVRVVVEAEPGAIVVVTACKTGQTPWARGAP